MCDGLGIVTVIGRELKIFSHTGKTNSISSSIIRACFQRHLAVFNYTYSTCAVAKGKLSSSSGVFVSDCSSCLDCGPITARTQY